jgi:MtaA/CmuA family methyltransferase
LLEELVAKPRWKIHGYGSMMNSLERVTNRLAGNPVDRPPNFDILMTFAAHFIHQPLSRYYQDYHVLVDANMAVLEGFNLDIVQAISDPYRETADFGGEIVFPEDGLPICPAPLLSEQKGLNRLPRLTSSIGPRMEDRLEAIRLFRERVGGQVPIMGWVEGAFAQAADLRGVGNLMMDLYERPSWVEELLERCVEVEIAFAQLQVQAGADLVGLGDAVASQVSPGMYRKYALPFEQRIISAIHARKALSRLHICGNTTRILGDMAQTGADWIDLDWMVDLSGAAGIFNHGPAICGNFDPVAVMLQGTPEEVQRATLACLRSGGPRCFSAGGCEIPDGTPPENLKAQSKALQRYMRADAVQI